MRFFRCFSFCLLIKLMSAVWDVNEIANFEGVAMRACVRRLAEKAAFRNGPVMYVFDDATRDWLPSTEDVFLLFDFKETPAAIDRYYYFNHVFVVDQLAAAVEKIEIYRNSALYNRKFTPKGKFLIFTNSIEQITETFRYFWDKSIINLVVVHDFGVYFSYPFWKQNDCGNLVDVNFMGNCCDVNFVFEKYPRRLDGCTMKVLTLGKHIHMPYIQEENLFDEHPGVLVEPFRLITEKYGLNVQFIVPSDQIQDAFPDKSATMFEKDMYERKFDLLAPEPFRLLDTSLVFESSDVVFFEGNLWIVPKPQKLSNVIIIMSLFTLRVWIIVFCVLITASITFWLMSKQKHETIIMIESILIVYRMTLSISIAKIPRSQLLRLLLLLYLIYAMHVNYFFQGKLSSVLTSPNYEPPVTSLDELAESGLYLIFYYEINMETLGISLHPAASELYSKSIMYNGSLNRPEIVYYNRNYSTNAFVHDLNVTDALRTQVRT